MANWSHTVELRRYSGSIPSCLRTAASSILWFITNPNKANHQVTLSHWWKKNRKISSWTWRFLSYVGRLQLVRFEITSLTNFWLATFWLPGKFLDELEILNGVNRVCCLKLVWCIQSEDDVGLWKQRTVAFTRKFSTKETWKFIRDEI